MTSDVIASNLLRLRKEQGFTQEQVAEQSGLSRSAYRALEKGRSTPRTGTLKTLADVLGIPLKDLLIPVQTLKRVRFRSLKRLKSRDQVLADVSRWLKDFAELERLIGDVGEHGLQPLREEANSVARSDMATLASRARDHFGLSEREPVHDICGLLESLGIKVYSISVATDAFMGLSVAEDDGGPAVVVNTWERLPVEAWIFSAVHELAHLILHLGAYDVSEEQENAEQEKEADQFASHFLMPQVVFRKEWEDSAGLDFVDRVLKIKRVFRVSWRTVLYRIAESFPDNERYRVWQWFNQEYKRNCGGRALLKHDEPQGIDREIYLDSHGPRTVGAEPAGMESHDFREDRLSLLVRRAVEAETITLSRGAEILCLPLAQMRERSASWIA